MDPGLWILVVPNLVALILCVVDKRRAQRDGRRIRERTLLLWALLAGSPGLLIGMVAVRHKVRKTSFLLRLMAIVLVQAVLVWLWLGEWNRHWPNAPSS